MVRHEIAEDVNLTIIHVGRHLNGGNNLDAQITAGGYGLVEPIRRIVIADGDRG